MATQLPREMSLDSTNSPVDNICTVYIFWRGDMAMSATKSCSLGKGVNKLYAMTYKYDRTWVKSKWNATIFNPHSTFIACSNCD